MEKTNKSLLWDYFEKLPNGSGKCKTCKKLDGMIEQLELTNPDLHKFCVNDNASNMQVELKSKANLYFPNAEGNSGE